MWPILGSGITRSVHLRIQRIQGLLKGKPESASHIKLGVFPLHPPGSY